MLEKILKEIEKQKRCCLMIGYAKEYNQGALKMAEVIENIIRKHMNDGNDINVTTKDDNGGWIPCEECLPEDGESVLCTDGEYVYLVEYDADSDTGFGDMDNMIAWRLLPEPCRPEKGSVQNETA